MTTRDNIRKLDIGCGRTMTAGYLRMDIDPTAPDLDYVGPMTRLPFEDNFLELIRATHCIEHIPIPVAKEALCEWLRALMPGGRALIDTPSILRNANLYLNGGWERDFDTLQKGEQEAVSLNGVPNKTLWLNFKCFSSANEFDIHFWNADPELLVALCLDAGFETATVTQTEPSLIVVATKSKSRTIVF